MAGLTPTGFDSKTLDTLVSEIEAEQKTTIDPALDTSSESVFGMLNTIFAGKLREIWELIEIVYNARVPKGATFAALEAVTAMTGTFRRQATYGTVVLQLTMTPGTTVPAGSIASVLGQPDNRWVTMADAVYSGSGPTSVTARADTTGKRVANASSITVIATPLTGWTAVTNPLDALSGNAVETDAELRVRRELELSSTGTGTAPAIQKALFSVPHVLSATVDENTSAFPDAMGRPPHSVEAVVQFTTGLSGADLSAARAALAAQLWQSVGGGIDTTGDQFSTITDANAQARVLRWSEPSLTTVYATVTIRIDPVQYAGDVSVQSAVVSFGSDLKMGDDVIRARLIAALLQVPGVVDVYEVRLGATSGMQQAQNLIVASRAIASFDTSRVTVVTQ